MDIIQRRRWLASYDLFDRPIPAFVEELNTLINIHPDCRMESLHFCNSMTLQGPHLYAIVQLSALAYPQEEPT